MDFNQKIYNANILQRIFLKRLDNFFEQLLELDWDRQFHIQRQKYDNIDDMNNNSGTLFEDYDIEGFINNNTDEIELAEKEIIKSINEVESRDFDASILKEIHNLFKDDLFELYIIGLVNKLYPDY